MNRNKILTLIYFALSIMSYVVSIISDDATFLIVGNTFAICAAVWGAKEN